MDQELAALYGTTGTTQEDQTKVAEAQLFAKLAADNGINLNELTDDQIQELWDGTFAKQATEEEKKEPTEEKKEEAKEEEKKAAAQAEFNSQREWQEKVAECDKLGRIMAHAYVQELDLIKQAMEKKAEKAMPFAGKETPAEEKAEEKEMKEHKKGKEEHEEKKASAIDDLAAKQALQLAHEAGLDVKVAAKRIDAIATLGGPAQSEKTASATSLEETIQIRALEFLEAAGYPVTWNQ